MNTPTSDLTSRRCSSSNRLAVLTHYLDFHSSSQVGGWVQGENAHPWHPAPCPSPFLPPAQMITIRYCEEAGLVARKIINPSDIKKRAGEPLTAGKGKQKMAKKTAAAAVNMPDSDAAGPADTAPALRRATPPDASWPHDQVAAWLRFRNVGAKALSTLVGLDGEELMALTKGDFIDAGVPQGKAVAVFRLLHPPGSAGQPISIE